MECGVGDFCFQKALGGEHFGFCPGQDIALCADKIYLCAEFQAGGKRSRFAIGLQCGRSLGDPVAFPVQPWVGMKYGNLGVLSQVGECFSRLLHWCEAGAPVKAAEAG